MMKRCNQCGGTEFRKDGKCKICRATWERKYNAAHREDRLAQKKAYHAKHHEKELEYNNAHLEERHAVSRAWHLARDFGISIEEYDNLLFKQNGVCAICGHPPNGKRLAVDHDHNTNKIRGLLCTGCNLALGVVNDSAETLSNAAKYLIAAK